jgi:pyridoxine 5-phosphate synthase
MASLGVNIDHVATIRQARRTVEPDPVWAAAEAELGGASCITFHLRKDRRHINDRDAACLRETVRACKLNMEMSLDGEIVAIALRLRPDQATLVPESRQEITTEGGLDAVAQAGRLAEATRSLREAGVVVSAFIDPEAAQVEAARAAGCDAIELHTGAYANACLLRHDRQADAKRLAELDKLRSAVAAGRGAGLVVHGGHGLTYANVTPVAAIRGFCEFNIGHSIVSRAVFVGLRAAVAQMRSLIEKAEPES